VARIAHLPKLKLILALGRIAHEQILATLGHKKADFPFAHGARHNLERGLILFDSFHCSRYNTSTGRLTPAMFGAVFDAIRNELR
jgi:uracil-DNA glycosylase